MGRTMTEVHDVGAGPLKTPSISPRTCAVPRQGVLAVVLWLILMTGARGSGLEDEPAPQDPKERRAAAVAIILWVALAILAVGIVGIGLIWGISRGARHVLRKSEPTQTNMRDIWFLNAPEPRKRKEVDPDTFGDQDNGGSQGGDRGNDE